MFQKVLYIQHLNKKTYNPRNALMLKISVVAKFG